MIDDPDMILIRYGEVALKDSNRGLFERQLQDNLEQKLTDLPHGGVERFQGGMRVPLIDDSPVGTITNRIARVPGVAWFAPGFTESRKPEPLAHATLTELQGKIEDHETFAIRTQRSDKNLEMNSMDYDREIGDIIRKNTHLEVDLDDPDLTVHVHLLFSESFVFFDRHDGLGGLPVGSSGDVLCLLSGGIDSPVASIQMMKRGCRTDFLHFYPYPSAEKALETKFRDLLEVLRTYTTEGTLYLAPYHEYDLRKAPVSERKEMVLFRRHTMRVADRIAKANGQQALITGESVGQVASQTLENIRAIEEAADSLILRPLVGLDKDDIIGLAESFGTYSLSIQDYQDCCSIQSSRVDTRTDARTLREIEEKHDLHEADDAVLDAMTVVEFDETDITVSTEPSGKPC